MTTTVEPRRRRNVRQGLVVSTRMAKTAVIQVERRMQHATFQQMIRRRKKFLAHDEAGACRLGDWVEIVESRPLSRRKHWRVRRILRRAGGD
ncbi:MAG: 30S ribosomal protein S17 [Acidobacteria bacterium]|nr:30S ribosomal protein S17 [Acidobacteriota bacterium]